MAEPTRREMWRARGRAFGLAAGAGLVAALGQAPFDFWPATLFGLALGYGLLARSATPRAAAFTGWSFATGYFALTFVWIVQPFLVEPEVYGWMAPFGLFFMATGLALFWMAGFAGAWALAPSGPLAPIAFAVSMGAAEWVRARIFTGLPWGGPGLAWIDTPVAQIAAFTGAFGLSVLTFALAAFAWHRTRVRGAMLRGSVEVLVVLALAWGLGSWRAAAPIPERPVAQLIRIVQPNAPQHLKWDPDYAWTYFDRARTLSEEPTEGTAPALVIWPETSIPSLMDRYPEVEASAAASAAPAPLIAGIRRLDGAALYNTLVLFEAGAPTQLYDKHHIVPFGEYIPGGELAARLGLHGLASSEGAGFSAGPGPAVLTLPNSLGTALPLICYEAIFPRDLRRAPERADWILQITNDAWFGTFSGPQQHLAQARMRAIEFGLPFLRAANTGITAAIDAHGQVIASLPLNTAGKLDVTLPGALPPPPYPRYGDTPLAVLLALTGLAVFTMRKRRM